MIREPRPVVIATPDRLLKLLQLDSERNALRDRRPVIYWRQLQSIVVDEVDQVIAAPGRYASLRERQMFWKHPPSAAVALHYLLTAHQPGLQSASALGEP